MNKNNGKDIVRKYFIYSWAVSLAWVGLVAVPIIFFDNILAAFAIAIVTDLPRRYIIRYLANKYLFSVLTIELNPFKFKTVIMGNRFLQPSAVYQVFAAYYSGDYQTTVNICTNRLQRRINLDSKRFYLLLLAYVYFELDDREKLQAVCNAFRHCDGTGLRSKRDPKLDGIIQAFEKYAAADLNAIKTLCETDNTSKETTYERLAKVQKRFYHAVITYRAGDKEASKTMFEEVISGAPNLHFAQLSQKYLDALENSAESTLVSPEIIPDANYQLPTEKAISRARVVMIIAYALIGVQLVIYAFSAYMQHDFENKLDAALIAEYGAYEFEEHFTIEVSGKVIENLCIVGKTDGQIDLVTVGTYDNGITTTVIKYLDNIPLETSFYLKNTMSGYNIAFVVYNDPQDIRADMYQINEIDAGEDTLYFCIKHVG